MVGPTTLYVPITDSVILRTTDDGIHTPFRAKGLSTTGSPPVTPPFLLSLLSTTIYLSISSIALEALQRILASVGLVTVVCYLDYAIGRGIGAGA